MYLLDSSGAVLYSVVLDHARADAPVARVRTAPIRAFVVGGGDRYVLGDDPRNPAEQKIFSAAPFRSRGRAGYVYIILAGERYEAVTSALAGSYYLRLGVGGVVATVGFALLIGALALWYLTRNLRQIIGTGRRFQEGDLTARVPNPEATDLAELAETYNQMADTIVANLEQLRSVETLRRELIANVSHDLRTPLAIMQGYVETVQLKRDSITPAEREKYFHIVQRSTEKLSQLINQLFDRSFAERVRDCNPVGVVVR